ncbi:MAG: hypothetical protein ACOZQL_10090 [Myxococcota bacterium]
MSVSSATSSSWLAKRSGFMSHCRSALRRATFSSWVARQSGLAAAQES